MNIGAGYQLPAGVSIEARYHFGLANIMANSSEEGADDFSFRHNVQFQHFCYKSIRKHPSLWHQNCPVVERTSKMLEK